MSDERLERAERALKRAGFTYLEGAAEWKPPLGKPPRFIPVPTLTDRERDALSRAVKVLGDRPVLVEDRWVIDVLSSLLEDDKCS